MHNEYGFHLSSSTTRDTEPQAGGGVRQGMVEVVDHAGDAVQGQQAGKFRASFQGGVTAVGREEVSEVAGAGANIQDRCSGGDVRCRNLETPAV